MRTSKARNWSKTLTFEKECRESERVPDTIDIEIRQIMIQSPSMEKLEWTRLEIEVGAMLLFDMSLRAIACLPLLMIPIIMQQGCSVNYRLMNPVTDDTSYKTSYIIHLYGAQENVARGLY